MTHAHTETPPHNLHSDMKPTKDGQPTVVVSHFASRRSIWPTKHVLTWAQLCAAMTTFRRAPADAKDAGKLGAWSPAEYLDGAKRSKHNVAFMTALVLDYDDGTDFEDAQERWGHWPRIVHTSWSHTEEHHKLRVIIPFEQPIPATDWRFVWRWAYDRDPRIDKACSDPSRLFYVPAISGKDHPHRAMVYDDSGYLLHPDVAQKRLLFPDPPVLQSTPTHKDTPPVNTEGTWGGVESTLAKRKTTSRGPDNTVLRALQDNLKTNPGVRMAAAVELGARITDGRAEKMVCPGCGRKSLWFYIQPRLDATPQAMCQHRNSCGWTGYIDTLLGGIG